MKIKSIILILFGMVVMINLFGCQTKEEPTPTPPTENPQRMGENPYHQIDEIEAIEIIREGEGTPLIENEKDLRAVATYIREAKFIENIEEGQLEETKGRMIVYLDQEILNSHRLIIAYRDDKQIYIGPEGREFLMESQELVDYINGYPQGKVVTIEEKAIPQEAKEWFNESLQEKGAYVFQHPDATYIKVIAGERPTGGYSLHLEDFEENEYPHEVIIEVKEPSPNEMVTEAITFPSLYIKVESDMATQYEVKSEDGEVYEVESKLIYAKLEEPKESEKIDNPVGIKGKIIAFEGAFIVRILEEDGKVLHEEHLQADSGGPNWGNFDEEIRYPQPTTTIGSIELGEYSAKDGSYQLREKIEVRFK